MPARLILVLSALLLQPFLSAELPGWAERFTNQHPLTADRGIAPGQPTALPEFTCKPAAPGRELVRVSLPFPPGALPADADLVARVGQQKLEVDLRPLTWHPGTPSYVRRALVTFPYEFPSAEAIHVGLELTEPKHLSTLNFCADDQRCTARWQGYDLEITRDGVTLGKEGRQLLKATVVGNPLTGNEAWATEIMEQGQYYLWLRVLVPDPAWPRIIETRLDALGRLALRVHVQRMTGEGGETAPDLGWRIDNADGQFQAPEGEHRFETGEAASCPGKEFQLSFPDAHLLRRGMLNSDGPTILYLRSQAREQVPQQLAAWRTATLVFAPANVPALNVLLEPALETHFLTKDAPLDLHPWPRLDAAMKYHFDSMAAGYMLGDDFGNIGSMPSAGTYSMNRLNHCPPLFELADQYGDARLREAAVLWCSNFYDLTIWWGDQNPDQFGGTRYNNRALANSKYTADQNFLWRSDDAVHFCTKGYDSFLYAWEATGDPRMSVALHWQVDYASRMVHTNQGEARNIGDVLDFVQLYAALGQQDYLDQALRLFRELRERVGEDGLFSQGGEPIVKESPFIDNDEEGYKYPFAKPYIIGYALAGLPTLLKIAPDEPRLAEVVHAVAHFLAQTLDPAGGWRYPHPRSSRMLAGQAFEHAAQLARAADVLEARGEDIAPLVDAVETVLQARVLGYARTGSFYGGVDGWERSTGAVAPGASVQSLYAHPQDRDPARDYTEGAASAGTNSPEGVVYFPEVLAFYLKHRPAERLYHANPQLEQVLARLPEKAPVLAEVTPPPALGFGIERELPSFLEARKAQLDFPLAWNAATFPSFNGWRDQARAKLFDCLLTPPPRVQFDPEIVAVEDRGSYEARKLLLNISGFYRIPAYLLVPKSPGPHPAMVALHDHGAHFSIGKEKVVKPFGVSEEVMADAADWTAKCYGGRWIGDVLAERGYVVFAMDALFWGERGRKEGVDYKKQETLSANLLQLGMTWPGVVTWDDLRSAEFVASLPEVDPARIGAVGLSMGCHRTWMLAAASDRIAAGVAICWMGTTEHLMVPGNNQTTGQSAYSMLVPCLRNFLDYPDVAAIAAPKPMLFYNGTEDPLFPVPGVEAAYSKMHAVWDGQEAGGRLETKLWPVPHEFNAAMQEEAFGWLERQLN